MLQRFSNAERFILMVILWLPALQNHVQAQSLYSIGGKVLSAKEASLEGCVVALLSASTGNILRTTFTDSVGRFQFTELEADTYKLNFSYLGFKKYETQNIFLNSENDFVTVDDILLAKSETILTEVAVTASVPFIERRLDRTIINPDAQISGAGSNALELLAKAPGVMVRDNAEIVLKGRAGVSVYIDDKPTYLSGAELEVYLKTITASDIKQIEILPNPPAKYEAAGNSGIINIKTKKSKQQGLNGTTSLNYGQGRFPRTTNNFTVNYSNKKIAFSSGVSLGAQGFYQDLQISRTYKNEDQTPHTFFNQRTYIKLTSQSYSLRAGVDYYITERTSIGINAKGLASPTNATNDNHARLLNGNGILENNVLAFNTEKLLFANGAFNANIRHLFDNKGKQIVTHFDYVTYRSNSNQQFLNTVFLPNGSNIYSDKQTGELPSSISIYAGKCDYENPLKNETKIDVGIKSSFIHTNNQAIYTTTKNGAAELNNDLTNHFKYNELINAAYTNITKSFKRVDLQAGLRFESTFMRGKQLGNAVKPASDFKRIYNNIFPTFYASCKLDSVANHVTTLSYGYRIDRPFFKDLNPFIRPLDKYTFYVGNPFVQPTFNHNVSLSYSFKTFITTTVSYSHSINNIQETIEINNGIYYSRPNNIGKSQLLNLSIESSIPFAKWLNSNVSAEIVYARYRSKLYTQQLNTQGVYFAMNINNSFSFKDGWSAELSGTFITDFLDSQFSFKAFGSAALGVQKKILKNKANLKLSVSDLFFSNRIRGTINNLENTDANWKSITDSRIVSITFSYRFGSDRNIKAKQSASGSDAEQGRVKK